MSTSFFPRLAADGIKKNKKLYVPYILTSIGMVAMYYIVIFLRYDGLLANTPGAVTVSSTLDFGAWVIALFAGAFMFYTNSFLMRRRKKEFGLYNMLGMNKGKIARIILWETVIVFALSLSAGFLLGITFSKLCELLLIKIMGAQVTYTMYIPPEALGHTAAVFSVIFVLLLLNSLRQLFKANAIELLHSESSGEKAPRANWVMGIIGACLLAAAYIIALKCSNPITAMLMFFVAVVMVIAATYLIMITGSVVMCRLLQRNKRYYYSTKHFVSVSSMTYRMKRNGAGLASICILCTMVLVMISSTSSLYFGMENTLASRYPREVNMRMRSLNGYLPDEDDAASAREKINGIAESHGASMLNTVDYRYAETVCGKAGDPLVINKDAIKNASNDSWDVNIVSIDDWNALTGGSEVLQENEVIINTVRYDYTFDTIDIAGKSYKIAKTDAQELYLNSNLSISFSPCIYIAVPDMDAACERLSAIGAEEGRNYVGFGWSCRFDTGMSDEIQKKISAEVSTIGDEATIGECMSTSRAAAKGDFLSLYGSLFFLGIMLSIVFMCAAVLIIYYKQISEGYEDSSRFEIMQKVGMTKKEIRKSINSQMLTVFFMPLAGAALHLLFAFPMIRQILLCFNLEDGSLFAMTTAICAAVFALVYIIVYRITSNSYFSIVSGARDDA